MSPIPIQLLIHPQKADLTICWLAAIMSEKSFKKRYKPVVINKIDCTKLCEEIEQILHNDSRSNGKIRFSLHLSSQLMYGITKLHSYQTTYFEKEVLETQQKLNDVLQEKEEDIEDITKNLDNLDIHPFELSLRKDPQLDKNLHLLPDEDVDHGLQMMMENAAQCANFGALTDEELHDMFEHDLDPGKLRMVQYSQERERTEIHDIEIVQEIHEERYSQTSHSSLLVDVAHTGTRSKELSLTPQKRVPQIQLQAETPTKRRRLSFEDTVAAHLPVPSSITGAATAEDVTVEEIRAPVSQQQVESQLQLFHTKSYVIKKLKKMIDKNTTLNSQLLQKQYQDINYKCKQSKIAQIHHFISAKDLLKQPSHEHKQWAVNLHSLFKNHVTGKFKSSTDKNRLIELAETEEALLAEETTSKLNLPTELSTLGKNTMIMADGSTLVTIANIDPNYLHDQDVAHERAEEILPPETSHISEAGTSKESNEASQVSLNSHDILAMLESLWCDHECVKFDKLMPDTYSPKDKTMTFQILLKLHAEGKIILMQKDCYDILWIRKYSDFD